MAQWASPSLTGRRANGTQASKTASAADDNLLNIRAAGYETTTPAYTGSKASIRLNAAEAFTSTANGTYINFLTTPTGSTTLTEVMRIGANGSLGVNTASGAPAGYSFYVAAGTSGLQGRVYMPGVTSASAATAADACFSTGGEVVTDSALCVVSARRFKNTIEDSELGLDLVKQLRPVQYYLNDSPERGQQFGLIAEEVEALDKRLVTYQADGQIRSVLYLNLIPVLIKAVQQLQAKLAASESH